ncbi:MAG TPA: hypothetical protein VK960_06200 [Acidimicrobiia bacterium]|nr:hypothetical protein [Acidimicrobiia bacterium]
MTGRSTGRRRRLAALLAVTAVAAAALAVAVPASASVSLADIAAAEEAADEAAAELAAAEDRLAEAQQERRRLEEMLLRLASREDALETEATLQDQTIRRRIARMYMVAQAGSTQFVVEDVEMFASRVAYLGAIAERDRADVIDLVVTAADVTTLRGEVQGAIGHWDAEIAARAQQVEDQRALHDEARAHWAGLKAQWEREEAARQAEIRRQEEELARQLAGSTSTTSGATTTSTTVSYPYVPSAGVEQWRSTVTEVFARWGLDRTKCSTRDGVEFCVGPQIDNALKVMECESGGNPMARNSSSGTSGLFQNHPYYWQYRVDRIRALHADKEPDLPADASIFNPEHNTSVAALLVWESRETLLGNRGGGGWSPAVWPEFNFDRYEEVGRGYSVWGLGPGPWGHWSCGSHRGVWTGSWIHPWAQQQTPP